MSDVTDADRERAWLVLCALPISIPGYSPETVRKANDHLAAALAEERAKARAPFLAVAQEWESRAACNPGWYSEHYNSIAAEIRRAAEETE